MNNQELANILIGICKNKRTTYAKGCYGQLVTEEMIKTKSNQASLESWYKNNLTRLRSFIAARNVYAFDCVCLIKAVLWGWSESNCSWDIYKANGVPDFGDWNMLNYCEDVSTDFTKIEVGEVLWMQGHVGVYVGNGLVAEATMSWTKNVLLSKLSDRVWLKHGKLKYVAYTVLLPIAQPTVSSKKYNPKVHAWQNAEIKDGYSFPLWGADGEYGDECDSVAKAHNLSTKMKNTFSYTVLFHQTTLKALGYYSRALDGLYGPKTKDAVKRFQRDKGFSFWQQDGVIGSQTTPYLLGVK